MLRRIDFGDYDLIITFFTLNRGKISVIAKSAKKSTKRFSGILELFSILEIVCRSPQGKGLPVLVEASLRQPFSNIRADIIKTAYASYWVELINEWIEEYKTQIPFYRLLEHMLNQLDAGQIPEAALSILFQMRFMKLSGLSPNLLHCSTCGITMDRTPENMFAFNLPTGGILCEKCSIESTRKICLTKGTIKQLLWAESGDIAKAGRIRFTPQALKEGLTFLEAFVPFYLGKKPRSLTFLQKMRG